MRFARVRMIKRFAIAVAALAPCAAMAQAPMAASTPVIAAIIVILLLFIEHAPFIRFMVPAY